MNRKSWMLAMAAVMIAGRSFAGEIGFIEEFSLARDRAVPLKQLIPGTEDYYYYHCLHFQNTEQWEKVDETLRAWIQRYNRTPRAIEIETRQALLTYPKTPQKTLDLIRQRLDLQFNHQRELLNQQPNLPTALNPALIAPAPLTQSAFGRYPNTVQGFEDAALERLVTGDLTADQRRHLLSRLHRPDVAGLVRLIVEDLASRNSGGFGSQPIHSQLLLAQLDELLKLKPELRNETNFVNVYLTRLRPSDDVNWRQTPNELEAYLDRLLAFVRTLNPSHNSLKAHVLYHRLALDRTRGAYNRDRFLEYIQLPRHVGYVERKFLEREESRRYPADLNADFSSVTLLPAVGNDEPLVRSYLMHFFIEAPDAKEFAAWINDLYLKHAFAETKIVNGLGDAEQWYSMLPPAVYQQLKERIDLEFAFTNKTELSVEEGVGLDVYVKNVPTLIVKVFEINTQNYYRANLREPGTDINLDGLVANEEKTYTYEEGPLRRVKRHFEFAGLNKRGAWVIDFIGNGVSSRALIRKGKLRYLVRTSSAGQVFTVLNEKNEKVPDATLWLAGTLYTPDKSGRVVTPFSNQPARQPIVLSQGDFASLEHFQQESENYELAAGMYVDREELLSRQTAQLVIRPSLRVNGTPVSLKALEDVRLTITSHDLDNVATTKVIPEFKLFEDRETIYEFQTPQRATAIQFQLTAKVQNLSRGQKVDVAAAHSVSLNEIDRTDKVEDLHFLKIAGSYYVDVLGKTGESQSSRPVQVALKLRDYRDPVHASLQTDARGRVTLGPLPGVVTVAATGPQGTSHAWALPGDQHTYPESLHAEAGQTIVLPYMGSQPQASRAELSLLELRTDNYVIDRFDALSIKAGLLRIDKLPPGDYSLAIKPDGPQVRINVAAGTTKEGYVLGDYRKLEVINPKPLQIDAPEVTEQTVKVRLQNANKFSRVHLFATRFNPAYAAFPQLAAIRPQEPYRLLTPRVDSRYEAGRDVGDEYRYIIDRKFKKKHPGNMLARPELLLNPWAVRTTETGEQLAREGGVFRGGEAGGGGMGGRPPAESPPVLDPHGAAAAGFANLDFLAESSLVLANLVPDDDGFVTIKRADLGSHQDLLFVAVDPENTASRRVTLPEPKFRYRDLRLAQPLDLKQHFTQQKRITVVPAGQQFVLPDITSARFQAYDTIASVYSLYATLHPDQNLNEFRFITEWPKLKPEQKREFYSKYASHELSFFLFKKDPEFRAALRAYLANKKDKTFLDRWILEEDLTGFTQPWNYERLNTFERVLLSQRLEAERPETQRYVKDHYDLLPPDIERFNHLFRTALKGSSLDTNDLFGLQDMERKLGTKSELFLEGQKGDGRPEGKNGASGFFPGKLPALAMPSPATTAPTAPPPADQPAEEPGRSDDAKSQELGASREKLKSNLESYRRRSGVMDGDANGERDEAESFFENETQLRGAVRQYYRKLDKTMEWAENNYYKLPIEQQNAALIAVNAFWNDYARQDQNAPFLSVNMAEPTHNFAEMLVALSLLDLPFEPGKHDTRYDGPKMTITSAGPLVAYHEEILPAKGVVEPSPILVSQNFFRHGDRYRHVNNEQLDKFVSDEFLVDVVYGCHIVLTNPTSSPKKLDVLLQIPQGSLPVMGGQNTKSVHLDLQPYHTQTLEYYFYFPSDGQFAHYPVNVGTNDEIVGFAQPLTFKVVNEPTNIDKESWDYLSQHGTPEQVVSFLKQNNLFRLNLDRIAFRMQDKAFFQQVVRILALRHAYNHTLWSYGVLHNEPPAIREFLQHADSFVALTGDVIDSPLLTTDPVARRTYEHLEYKPLVNARTGQLGKTRQILNDRFLGQYQRLMKQLSYRRQLGDADTMAVTYYLLLQDRVDEALEFFGRINPDALPTRLQYDYCAAYVGFYREEPEDARAIALKYANHPVDRWRNAFAAVAVQADEIAGRGGKLVDKDDRNQVTTELASTDPDFEFTVEARRVKLAYQNLKEVRVNYYLMDVELLFSRNPFVQQHSGQFAFIRPNATQTVALPEKGKTHEFALPEQFRKTNVLVEIVGAGETKSQASYANEMNVQTIENYGQVKVTQGGESKPLPKVYVKAYARMKDGSVKFYKDGYTDLRGRFDYASLSTNELEFVQKFSLLVFSDEHGAMVREANPPKQ